MSAKVILTITEGKLPGRQYIFDSRTSCIIGRAKDCNIKLPNDKNHSAISRYHCLLDINPPDIRIRDFGSKNGTYINGKKIGQRQDNQTPEEAAKEIFPEFDLQDNDEIKLSNTVFAISIESKPEEIKINHFFPPTIDFNNTPTEAPNLLE
jgi:pSer/pThr/pTyr-binding forkhead associated (FHA) protein